MVGVGLGQSLGERAVASVTRLRGFRPFAAGGKKGVLALFYLRIAGQKVFRVVVVVRLLVVVVRKDFKKLDKNKLALKNFFWVPVQSRSKLNLHK